MLRRTDTAGGTGILPRTNFRTRLGIFRAGVRVTRLQKDYRTLVRIAHVSDVGYVPNRGPTAHTRGGNADTCALFVESMSSPIVLLPTPTFPLSKPAMQWLMEGSAMAVL